MGNILGRFLLPHPPAAIEEFNTGNILDILFRPHALKEVGREKTDELTKTIESCRNIGKKIAALQPKTIVVITPHGPCFEDYFYMPSPKRISGDFSAFGVPKVLLGFDNNIELAKAIGAKAKEKGLAAGFIDDRVMKKSGISYDLDHGVLVPLYFVRQYYSDFKLVSVSLSGLGGKDHYRFGMALRDALRAYSEDTVIIASGDLSHKVSEASPYGFAEEGPIFDKTVRRFLLEENVTGFLGFDPALKEKAAQCGLDAYRTLLGTLDGFDFTVNIHSYEAPFGIGYLTASLYCGKAKESVWTQYAAEEEIHHRERREQESPPVQLARKAVAEYLKDNKEIGVPPETPKELTENSGGVFVSFQNDGHLRGCVGTTAATHPNLAMEIICNAVGAAAKDPRFAPIRREELTELTVFVDILSDAEEITDQNDLDPKKYGIIVENRGKQGVLLPDLPGIDTPAEQIRAAREKAGIHPWHKLKIKRFTVTRYR